jgi:hypothetical protein
MRTCLSAPPPPPGFRLAKAVHHRLFAGDVDVVSASFSAGELYLHENLGGPLFAFAAKVVVSSGAITNPNGLYLCDLNGDNLQDIVVVRCIVGLMMMMRACRTAAPRTRR